MHTQESEDKLKIIQDMIHIMLDVVTDEKKSLEIIEILLKDNIYIDQYMYLSSVMYDIIEDIENEFKTTRKRERLEILIDELAYEFEYSMEQVSQLFKEVKEDYERNN